VEDENTYSGVDVTLGADEASLVVEILLRLAALIDPDDPDGLRNTSGQKSSVQGGPMGRSHRRLGALAFAPAAVGQRRSAGAISERS
jgi:hypothetical protein